MHQHFFAQIALLALLAALTPFAIDMYLPAIPTIADELAIPIEVVQQSLSIYVGCYAVAQLVFGPLSDAKGRLFALYSGLAIFIASSIATIFAYSATSLLLMRAIQGFGGAAIAVALSALIRDSYKKNQASKVMSLVTVMMSIAPMIAPIIGGYILVLVNWHAIFAFLALLAVLVSYLIYRYIPESLPIEKRSPVKPQALLKKYLYVLSQRDAVANIMLTAFAFSSMLAFVTGSSFVYIEYFGVSEANYGYLFGINVIGMMLASSINARFVERYGAEKMLQLGIVTICISAVALGYLSIQPPESVWWLVPACTLSTASVALISGNSMAITMDKFAEDAGKVAALAGSIRFGAGALSGVLLSQLHNDTTVPMTSVMALSGFASVAIYLFSQTKAPSAAST